MSSELASGAVKAAAPVACRKRRRVNGFMVVPPVDAMGAVRPECRLAAVVIVAKDPAESRWQGVFCQAGGRADAFRLSAHPPAASDCEAGRDFRQLVAHHLKLQKLSWPAIAAPGKTAPHVSGRTLIRRRVDRIGMLHYLCNIPSRALFTVTCQLSLHQTQGVTAMPCGVLPAGTVAPSDERLAPPPPMLKADTSLLK
jgi:hypothetical protein